MVGPPFGAQRCAPCGGLVVFGPKWGVIVGTVEERIVGAWLHCAYRVADRVCASQRVVINTGGPRSGCKSGLRGQDDPKAVSADRIRKTLCRPQFHAAFCAERFRRETGVNLL